jgi:hypothetical protein
VPRLATILRWTLLAAAVVATLVVRRDLAPRRSLRGTDPLIGSLDTWPEVPRRAAS